MPECQNIFENQIFKHLTFCQKLPLEIAWQSQGLQSRESFGFLGGYLTLEIDCIYLVIVSCLPRSLRYCVGVVWGCLVIFGICFQLLDLSVYICYNPPINRGRRLNLFSRNLLYVLVFQSSTSSLFIQQYTTKFPKKQPQKSQENGN